MASARSAWTALVTALAVFGCSEDHPPPIRYEHASIQVSIDERRRELSLWIKPDPSPKLPVTRCAPKLHVHALVNGVETYTWSLGGGERDFDGAPLYCNDLEFATPFAYGTNHFDVVFKADRARDDFVAGWRIAAEWNHATRVWTDDDLQAALLTGKPFEMRWEPVDAPAPRATVWNYDPGADDDAAVEEVERAPGRALYGFVGGLPETRWSVVAFYESEEEVLTHCEGFTTCDLKVRTDFALSDPLPAP